MAKGVLNWTPTLAARKAEDHRKINTSGRMTRNSILSGRPVQARGKPGGNGGAKRLMRGGRPVNWVEIGGGGIFVAVDKPDPGRGACRPEDRGQFLRCRAAAAPFIMADPLCIIRPRTPVPVDRSRSARPVPCHPSRHDRRASP